MHSFRLNSPGGRASSSAMRYVLGRIGVAILASLFLLGADWSACQTALDRLRSRATEASGQAARTNSASGLMESKKRELDDCRAQDAKRDTCRTLAEEYDSAGKRFQSAKGSLDSALDDVESARRSVNRSCEYSSASITSGSDPLCWLVQRMKDYIAPDKVMETCKTLGKSEEQCRACIQLAP